MSLLQQEAGELLQSDKARYFTQQFVVDDYRRFRKAGLGRLPGARVLHNQWVRDELRKEREGNGTARTDFPEYMSCWDKFYQRVYAQARYKSFIFVDEKAMNSVVDVDEADGRNRKGLFYFIMAVRTGKLDRRYKEEGDEEEEECDDDDEDSKRFCRQKFRLGIWFAFMLRP